mmetsp:Transcript_38792/g.95458  ORF Transcript_38792/g.95458 Transcript_38792/m.95458 type:complete len:375 (-) Transcript_38792:247-1371(-)
MHAHGDHNPEGPARFVNPPRRPGTGRHRPLAAPQERHACCSPKAATPRTVLTMRFRHAPSHHFCHFDFDICLPKKAAILRAVLTIGYVTPPSTMGSSARGARRGGMASFHGALRLSAALTTMAALAKLATVPRNSQLSKICLCRFRSTHSSSTLPAAWQSRITATVSASAGLCGSSSCCTAKSPAVSPANSVQGSTLFQSTITRFITPAAPSCSRMLSACRSLWARPMVCTASRVPSSCEATCFSTRLAGLVSSTALSGTPTWSSTRNGHESDVKPKPWHVTMPGSSPRVPSAVSSLWNLANTCARLKDACSLYTLISTLPLSTLAPGAATSLPFVPQPCPTTSAAKTHDQKPPSSSPCFGIRSVSFETACVSE